MNKPHLSLTADQSHAVRAVSERGGEPTIPDQEPHLPCPDCPAAALLASAALVQCVCGRWHGPDDARWPRETPEPSTGVRLRPGLDAPPGAVPEPRRDRRPVPLAALRESPEVAAVRVLLTELRPYGPSPDDDPARPPPKDGGASLAPRAGGGRAPWDVTAPAGAFQRLPPALDAEVIRRIARVPSPRDRASLDWLRTRGTLARGFGPLAALLAVETADTANAAAWACDQAHGHDRARAWGARRIAEACAAWDASASEVAT